MIAMKRTKSNFAGFTMIEMLGVLVIISIISFFVIPNIPAVKRIGEDSQMKAKASQLNMYMSTYLSEQTVRAGLQTWKDAATDDARYTLLRPYMERAPATLEQFGVKGYSITFPDEPRGSVVITTPEGESLVYQ